MTKLVRNHSHWGAFLAEVEDGRIVGVRPFEHDPDPSHLIKAIPEAVHSQTRIAQPMVREGWLKHGRGHGEGRGREPFVPVSWEQALDLVAGELARVRRDHGHDAIMGGSQGWSSAGIFHEARAQLHRFLSAFGGFVDQATNYSFGAALAFLPHIVGSAQSVTGPLTSWSSIARHAKLMVLFGGGNPKNTQVSKGGCAAIPPAVGSPSWRAPASRSSTSARSARTARRRGAGMDSDPAEHRHRDAARADPYAGQRRAARPGLPRELLRRLRARAPYLMGETDGQPKDADWAAPITGVPADTIRALARRMAATRTMVTASWSLQRAHHGEQPYWAVILLASSLGQIGLPGGGFGFGYGSGDRHRRSAARFPAPAMDSIKNPLGRAIPAARISDCLLHPGELRLQRQARHLSRHPAGLLGRRQSVPPSSGHQQAARRPGGGPKPSSCTSRGGPRPRAMPTSCCRRPRRSSATTSAARAATSSSSRCSRRSSRSARRATTSTFSARWRSGSAAKRVHAGPRRDGLAAPSLRGWRDGIRTNEAAMPDFDTFWADGYLEIPQRAEEYVIFGDFRADPEKHKLRRHPAGSSFTPRRSRASATTIARRIRPGSSRGNGSAAPLRPIRCISSPASRATGCTARWIAAGQRPRQGRGPRGDCHQSRRRQKRAASTTAMWCASTIRAARALPAPS